MSALILHNISLKTDIISKLLHFRNLGALIQGAVQGIQHFAKTLVQTTPLVHLLPVALKMVDPHPEVQVLPPAPPHSP